MDSGSGNPPGSRPSVLEAGRQDSNQSCGESQTDGAGSGHITIPEPQRPSLPKRNTLRGESTKSISEALRLARTREEQETLLGDEEQADDDGCYPPRQSDAPRVPNPHRTLPIYTTIHKIRRLIYASIDDPYSNEQLRSPRMNAAVIRPLVDHIYDPDDVSIIYCLLVNRIQFLREQSYQAHHQTVNITRANVCELIASRVLRRFDEDHEGREGLLKVANVLVAGFEPFQGAPRQVLQDTRNPLHWSVRWKLARPEYNNMLTALEVAIVSEAKSFLASSACQRIVDNVYRGRIIYTPTSFIDILPDHYKNRGISLYDPRKAPLLNQYRLIVPRTRNWIEVGQFMLLLLLYILTMINKADTIGPSHLAFSIYELAFIIYAFGWTLDEIASILEHGWTVHTENLWSFLDIAFVVIFSAYFSVRMHGLMVNDGEWSKLSLDLLSVAMPVMLPRLAFCLMPENMLFISLRAMMADFTFLTILAAWCFGGFLIAMRWLSEGADGLVHGHHPMTIAKWMLWIWFGLDGTGVQRSVDFHWFLGPALMITFAFLGNTLFLTILVAMLSNTYQNLAQNATAEIQFRRAVLTFEGVKSDSLFAYRPPFNVLALILLLPMKWCLTPRWFHKVNITAVRILNAPILCLVSLYERKYLWKRSRYLSPPRKHTWLHMWERFGAHGDLQAVFDTEPPQEIVDEMDDIDDVLGEGEGWDGNGGYIGMLRARRGSRTVSEGSGVWGSRNISRDPGIRGLGQSWRSGGTRRRTSTMRSDTLPVDGAEV
ncbi:receptor-activated Ca2+-permeable cation channel [Hortaea werneckii]|nr:receptor-activated Ca2+-permeable cation channel [Hortaea werneckii]KAI6881483.1 receptor-activated Ca2+-permeable cation channel [Hortaea werneckii]KAI6998030.1 receptor-activated Ca2+-permeable cation channel [Hortaea werneckii]KAI7143155.1 receptor-activated Ca2+-permeable cation channel [Hortaea werneckii]KAI7178463.1 receptor-activated Ca2+-permeable cation channel [Hortaea werneckii]